MGTSSGSPPTTALSASACLNRTHGQRQSVFVRPFGTAGTNSSRCARPAVHALPLPRALLLCCTSEACLCIPGTDRRASVMVFHFVCTTRCLRCLASDRAGGLQVLPLEFALDGVEMKHISVHSTQLGFIRCPYLPVADRCKDYNVQPVIVIPGPTAPKSFDVFNHLVFKHIFAAHAPHAGASGLLLKRSQCAVARHGRRTLQPHSTPPCVAVPMSRAAL